MVHLECAYPVGVLEDLHREETHSLQGYIYASGQRRDYERASEIYKINRNEAMPSDEETYQEFPTQIRIIGAFGILNGHMSMM